MSALLIAPGFIPVVLPLCEGCHQLEVTLPPSKLSIEVMFKSVSVVVKTDISVDCVTLPNKSVRPGSIFVRYNSCGDSNAVGTGSFNWTASADQRNAENFVIIRLKYIVEEFQDEFEYLWEINTPEEVLSETA